MIELDINVKKSDEMKTSFHSSYKLYKDRKYRSDAEAHCQEQGGHLASIRSQLMQTLAEKEAEGNSVWLGGRKVGGIWQWDDDSVWNFTNWQGGKPSIYGGQYLAMASTGKWDQESSGRYEPRRYFICQGTSMTLTENNLTRIELGKEQLPFLPFRVLFKSQAIDQAALNISSSEVEKRISGFSLKWFLENTNRTQTMEKLPARYEDWKQDVPTPRYKEPLLHDLAKLAKELRLKNVAKKDIFTRIVSQKPQEITRICRKDHSNQ